MEITEEKKQEILKKENAKQAMLVFINHIKNYVIKTDYSWNVADPFGQHVIFTAAFYIKLLITKL